LAVLRDITAIKQAESEIVRLNRELEQKVLDLRNANDELDAFNSTVSHDLRTPLIIIRGFCTRIRKNYASLLDDRFSEQVGVIEEGVTKMDQLINDLLAYARFGKQALRRRPVAVAQLVGSVVEELRAIYPEGEVRISPLADCIGDEHMLRQVFVNLLSNAFKFTSQQPQRVIEIGCIRHRADTVFFVKDNGIGFDMAAKEKLFTVFQRLHSDERFHGTGMGLAIVKRIVSLHGGRVWAEGELHHGATFYFALPTLDET
jgi:light-regulated signal transduction histidine kinase (bacteriophytochrome)